MKTPYIKEKLITQFSGIIGTSPILDEADIVEGLIHSGFNRNDILLIYKINKSAKKIRETVISEIIMQYAYDENVIKYLAEFAHHINIKDEDIGQKLLQIIKPEIQDCKEVTAQVTSNMGDDIYQLLNSGLEQDIKPYFFKGIKSKDYVLYLREMLIILSDHYHSLCKIKGLGEDQKENEAINLIFNKIPESISMVGVDVSGDNGKNIKEGLQNMLNGTFKKLRNVMMHNTQQNCDISGDEFITHANSINNLLKESRKYFPQNS